MLDRLRSLLGRRRRDATPEALAAREEARRVADSVLDVRTLERSRPKGATGNTGWKR